LLFDVELLILGQDFRNFGYFISSLFTKSWSSSQSCSSKDYTVRLKSPQRRNVALYLSSFYIGWSVPGGQYNRRISTSQIFGGNSRRAITTIRCCTASLKTTRFCRNMYPLLRRAILKHYPLSVELRIHSTSSSSSSNGGTLQTTLTLCFLVNIFIRFKH